MRPCLLLLAALLPTAAPAAERPNIVLIFADDLGYGDLGCYGATDIRTPHIDRLAAEGTRFTSFCVAQPVCTASRAALLTGCYPNRVRLAGALNHTSTSGIHPGETLLSELLAGRGYATAVHGKWHLGHRPPFLPTRRGFGEFFGLPYSNDNGPLHPVTRGIPALPLYDGEKIVERDPDQSQLTRRLTERAVAFIEKNKDRPFFLYLPHVMPHVPIFASRAFAGTSKRGLYGDVVQELDWGVGQVLAALKKHGLEEKTLVLFASDNGPFLSYGEHAGSAGRLREGKLTTFEGGVRVPFLARWPGRVPKGRVCAELMTTMDLFATLVRLGGAAPKRPVDGIDLSGLLLGEKGARGRDVFWYYSGDELHAVRQGRWKLHLPHEYLTVAAAPGKGGKPSNFGQLAPLSIEVSGIRGIASRHGYRVASIGLSLYDLDADPGERSNVADQHPDVVRRLQTVAAAARADLGDALTKAAGKNVRAAGDDRPNILLILSDDHSAAHVGCYGNKDVRTPNLDRLAAEGMRFDRAHVTTPQCVPSRASIMTGRGPIDIQMTRFSAPLPGAVKSFPELLRARGYFAGVAGRTYHLDGSRLPPETQRVFDTYGLRTFAKRLDYAKTAGARPQILAQYREFLDAVPKGKPFVLQLCFSDPHRPLDRGAIDRPHDPTKLKLPAHYPDTKLVREDFARYYDEIARMDGDVGTVLAELKKRGLFENTIVVFMGDNGAAQLRGKGTLYDFGVRVPLLLRWPGRVKAGSSSGELISGEDLAPTFLEAGGAAPAAGMTGRSFLPLAQGQPYDARPHVFCQRGAHGSGLPTNSAAFDLGRCVVTRRHKLIYNALWQLPYTPVDFAGDAFWKELRSLHQAGKLSPTMSRLYFAPSRPMFELYDLEADPAEMTNLAGKAEVAQVEKRLKAALQEWMILQRDFVPLPVPPPPKKQKR